jgi:hypothetical protein
MLMVLSTTWMLFGFATEADIEDTAADESIVHRLSLAEFRTSTQKRRREVNRPPGTNQ